MKEKLLNFDIKLIIIKKQRLLQSSIWPEKLVLADHNFTKSSIVVFKDSKTFVESKKNKK